MAQTTNFNIKANLSGTAFRTNVNEKLAALLTQNSGQIEPTNPQQGMFWLDTSNENTHYLKIRGETIWSIVCSIDVATGTILYENVHNAISSTKLSNKKIIALQGDITANISTDFSTNVTLNTTFSENAVAPNSAKLNGLQASLSKAANTIAQRDSAGDITTRLFRSSYAENQASQNASICYRESSKESNNYHKFMTPAMFKSYLQNIGVKITDTQRAITDSVSTTSSEVCASATAVKNAYNRATQALNTANSAVTSTNAGTASAGIGAGAVGSYVYAIGPSNTVAFGGTTAGSTISPTSIFDRNISIRGWEAYTRATTLSGTWRCMGYHVSAEMNGITLWLRIA